MPPKPKITREMILNAVLDMTRKEGFEAVNARSIAGRLCCSTRPIFTCYGSMDELKADFLEFAFEYYRRYAADYGRSKEIEPFLFWPLSYVQFAKEETNLFKLLFIKDMDLDMTEAKDFYKELGNEERAKAFSEIIGVQPEEGKKIFLDLFFYTHGIAVLAAAGKVLFDRTGCEEMLRNVLKALVKQEREKDENQSVSDRFL